MAPGLAHPEFNEGYMTNPEINTELVQMLTDARLSARLQLLDALESKLDTLKANHASADQIISTLRAWANIRQLNVTKEGSI
ncbi:hypothetical protein Z042_01475 [Chania multitudinisentens RB-25]|uniref:Uncharacterized protein n=1 Tax=Chania multitudinisentens RB-25 TaxID=1441930 RepID=W0LJR3_9GAMM|nr:hypothetical protein [Chania multitudinisentens]AHG22577.1 hypothetical protein Z042_01475 [Chania multitudinisentens RB-25]